MSKSVYIETTIPNAHETDRQDPRSVAQRDDTRQWWAVQRSHYDCFTSQEVIDELAGGVFPGQEAALDLISQLPLLEINEDVKSISEVYVRERLMPGLAGQGDSLHLALASYHEVDFLLTWNIRHLANPNKHEHLVVVNRRLALLTPSIVTPEMLWLEEIEDDNTTS